MLAMKERLPAVDGLRGLAVLLVTLFHLWYRAGQRPFALGSLDLSVLTPLILNAGNAVALFFTVSGFCLFYPLARASLAGRPWPRWSNFYQRRAIRILPAYWVALAVWLPLWLIAPAISGSPMDTPDWWRQLWTHLTFTHGLSDQTVMGIDAVLWSLGTEIHFYAAFPLLAFLVARWPLAALLGSYAFTVGLRYVLADAGYGALAWNFALPCRLVDFVVGMYIAHLFARQPQGQETDELPAWLSVVGLAGIGGLLAFPYVHSQAMPAALQARLAWWWGDAIFAPCWAALLVLALFSQQANRFWSWRPLALLGIVSYSVYLYNPMIGWFDFALQPVLAGYLFPYGLAGGAAYQGLILIGIIALGSAGYLLVERPFLGLRARLRQVPPAAAPPPPARPSLRRGKRAQ